MNAYTTMDGYVIQAIWALVLVGSIYFAGRMAERRGRSFKNWAWIAGVLIGPLALPLLFLLPDLQRKDPKDPKCPTGGKPPADAIAAVKPVIQGSPDPSRPHMSFAERQNRTMRICSGSLA